MRITILVLYLSLITQSCATKTAQENWDKNNLQSFEVDDPKVQAAMKAAHDSLNFYIDYFKQHHGQKNYKFFLKKNFEDKGEFEHMWSEPFEINETGFRCVLDNDPTIITTFNVSDTLQIDFGEIEDFIIVTADSTMIGNYLEKSL